MQNVKDSKKFHQISERPNSSGNKQFTWGLPYFHLADFTEKCSIYFLIFHFAFKNLKCCGCIIVHC